MIWNIAISSAVLLNQPLLGGLAPIRQAGFRFVEVSAHAGHFDYEHLDLVRKIRDEMDGLGLQTVSMHAPYSEVIDLTMPDEAGRKRSVATVEAAADALKVLGGTKLVVHAGSTAEEANNQVSERLNQSLRSLKHVYDHCQENGVKLVIENMLGHLVGGRNEELQWVLSRLPKQDVGFCLDTGHSFLAGNLLKNINLFAPYLVLTHTHDNLGVYDDHLPPGEGKIDWPKFLDMLASVGFEGELVIEAQSNIRDASLLRRAWESARFLKACCRGKPYSVNVDDCDPDSVNCPRL